LLAALLTVHFAAAVAQEQPVVKGRVVEDQGGQPVKGARIRLEYGTPTRTDDNGRFVVGYPPSQPFLTVFKPGFVRKPVQLPKPGDKREMVIRLTRAAVLTVHVYDASGEPARASMVRLSGRGPDGSRGATAATDDRGQFRVGDLGAGKYTVSVGGSANGTGASARPSSREITNDAVIRIRDEVRRRSNDARANVVVTSATIDLRAGDEKAIYVIDTSPPSNVGPTPAGAGEIRGTVRDEFGDPVERATVELFRASTGADGTVELSPVRLGGRSDDRGAYRIPRVAPGQYYLLTHGDALFPGEHIFYPGGVSFRDARPVQVAANELVTGMDFRMNPALGVRLTGVVITSDGQPRNSTSVELTGREASGAAVAMRAASISRSGTFEFLNVAPGSYTISVRAVPQNLRLPTPPNAQVVDPRRGGNESGSVRVDVSGEPDPVVLRTAP
jgi:hypothetical protein